MPLSSNFKKISFWIAAVLLLLSFSYLLFTFHWQELWLLWKSSNLNSQSLFLMLLTIPGYWFLRALRWAVMLRESGFTCSLSKLYLVTAVSLSMAQFTPFQSGEVLKMELLKKSNGLDRSRGYSSFLFERVVDLFLVSVTALVALVFWSDLKINQQHLLIFLLLVLGGIIVGWFFLRSLAALEKISRFISELRFFLKSAKLIFLLLFISCLSWLLVAAGWHFAFQALGDSPGYFNVILLVSLVTVINLSSMIPGAVGISEAAIAVILLYLGQTQLMAQAGALLIRGYGVVILLLGFLHYLGLRFFQKDLL